jgi:broad specificity phosphatase PhoE
VLGWESASEAQRRILYAIADIAARTGEGGDVAIISHGTIGALLLCKLLGETISARRRQPGSSGGNYFVFEFPTVPLQHGWVAIE